MQIGYNASNYISPVIWRYLVLKPYDNVQPYDNVPYLVFYSPSSDQISAPTDKNYRSPLISAKMGMAKKGVVVTVTSNCIPLYKFSLMGGSTYLSSNFPSPPV